MCIYPHIPTNNGPGERKKRKKMREVPSPLTRFGSRLPLNGCPAWRGSSPGGVQCLDIGGTITK